MVLNFGKVEGLPAEEQELLNELKYTYDYHQTANYTKQRYYNGNITLREVNLGIALPSELGKLQIGCAWGAKTVDVLASRSMFDGFVTKSGDESEDMEDIVKRNHLIAEYNKAVKEELKYGCAFAEISGEEGDARVRFYSPQCAAAIWNAREGRIKCGFVFDDGRRDESDIAWSPEYVNFHTDKAIWELHRDGGTWYAAETQHDFGEPLMVAIIWDATHDKPFGQSRLKKPIRRMIDSYHRTMANATIGLEFATSPQKYLLGISDDQYDSLIGQKFKQYVGNILLSTTNPETGEKPTFGQLTQGNIEPHAQYLRMLATQFSAATGLTATDVGVISDANPTSSDAILAQSQTLVLLATQLNIGNGDALNRIAKMATAIEYGTTPDELPENTKEMIAHFKNPAMPSIAATTDAALKIATAREGFSKTNNFLEMTGFDQADIRRIKAQESKQEGKDILKEEFAIDDNGEGLDRISGEDGKNQQNGGESDGGLA